MNGNAGARLAALGVIDAGDVVKSHECGARSSRNLHAHGGDIDRVQPRSMWRAPPPACAGRLLVSGLLLARYPILANLRSG